MLFKNLFVQIACIANTSECSELSLKSNQINLHMHPDFVIHPDTLCYSLLLYSPNEGRADPGGMCNTGPTRGQGEASFYTCPGSKNQIISLESIDSVSEIKLIRTDTTL